MDPTNRTHALLICLLLCSMTAFAQKVRERLPEEEKINKELLKDIKKQYKAKKVTIERLEDGKKYYILHGANASEALLREDQTPVKFKGLANYRAPKGKTKEEMGMADFFYGYKPKVVYFEGLPYYQMKSLSTYAAGIYDMDGNVIVPPTCLSKIDSEVKEGKTYLKGTDSYGQGAVYDTSGRKIGLSNKNDIRYYPAAAAGYTNPSASGIGLKIWHPEYKSGTYCFGQNASAKNPQGQVVKFHRDNCTNIDGPNPQKRPGYYTMILDGNYILKTGSRGAVIREKHDIRNMDDGSTGNFKVLDAIDDRAMMNELGLYDRNWNLIADSFDRLQISDPDQMVYFYRYYGKPFFMYRKGAVSLTDSTINIPPRFNDIIVRNENGAKKIYVKDWAFGDYREYTPGDEGHVSFADKTINQFEKTYAKKNFGKPDKSDSFLLSNQYVSKIPEDSLKDYHKAMFIYGILDYGKGQLEKQQDVLDCYASGQNPLDVPRLKAYMTEVPGLGMTFSDAGAYLLGQYHNKVEGWMKATTNPTDSANYARVLGNLTAMKTDLDFNTRFAIPQARDSYNVAQEQEKLRRQQEEEARLRAIREERDARIAAAVVGMFSNILGGLTSNIGGGSAKNSSYKAAKRGSGKSVGRNGGGDSSNHSGDKERLKREIAAWDDKIKKAEESYQQALENYYSNKSWEAKRVVDSKLKTINEFTAERDRCKAELASY